MSPKLLLPVVNTGQPNCSQASCTAPPFWKEQKKKVTAPALCESLYVYRGTHPKGFYKLNKNQMCVRHYYHPNVAIVRGKQAIDCVKL